MASASPDRNRRAPVPDRARPLSDRLSRLLVAAYADATRRAYRSDLEHFGAWCEQEGRCPLPASPETVAEYLAAHVDDLKPSTLSRRLAAISQAHKLAELDTPTTHPTVRRTWKGLRRTVALESPERAAVDKKAPLVVTDLRRVLRALPDTLTGIRDRALLLVGFAGGMRRSEIVALNVADLEEREEGIAATIRRSKSDQEGEGRKVAIPYGSNPETCPVRALRAWLAAAQITTEGPLFRRVDRHGNLYGRLSTKGVALVVKRSAERVGLDPDRFSGHSLRAGFATTAGANGYSERQIANQTGHKSDRVLRGYIREGALFRDNPSTGLGL